MRAKKVLALILVAMLTIGMLVSCGSDKAAGTWKLTKASAGGQELTAEQLSATGMGEAKITLKDGKATVEMLGQTAEGTYKVDGDNVTISTSAASTSTDDASATSAAESITGTIKDNQLTIEQSGTSMTFEKQ